MNNSANNKKHKGNMKMVILSLVLAAALCIFVNYTTNPDISTELTQLPIRFTGESALRESGLVITGKSDIPPSSVVVSGKRRDLVNNMDKIMIDVDVSNITEEGEYSLTGSIVLPTTQITVEKEKYSEIPIKVEKLCEKEIPIKIRQVGTAKNLLVKSEPLTDTVTLTGAQSELDTVSYGIADVDISKITSDNTASVKYLLLNQTGGYIEKNETLEAYTAEIKVKNTVYTPKTLPIKLELTEEMSEKYVLNENKCVLSATAVSVGVRPENTDESVKLYIDNVDNPSGEYSLSETEGMYIPDTSKTIQVRLDVTPKVTKDLELEPSAEGLGENLSAQIDKVTVTVTGIEEKLNTDNIKARVTLTDMTPGVYSVPVEIEGDGISVDKSYSTNVTITENY